MSLIFFSFLVYRQDIKQSRGKKLIHGSHILGKSVEDAACKLQQIILDYTAATDYTGIPLNPRSLTYRIGVKESTGCSDDAFKHLVVELHTGLHADDKEVDGPNHGDHTEGADNGSIDAKVEVMLVKIFPVQFDPGG